MQTHAALNVSAWFPDGGHCCPNLLLGMHRLVGTIMLHFELIWIKSRLALVNTGGVARHHHVRANCVPRVNTSHVHSRRLLRVNWLLLWLNYLVIIQIHVFQTRVIATVMLLYRFFYRWELKS